MRLCCKGTGCIRYLGHTVATAIWLPVRGWVMERVGGVKVRGLGRRGGIVKCEKQRLVVRHPTKPTCSLRGHPLECGHWRESKRGTVGREA